MNKALSCAAAAVYTIARWLPLYQSTSILYVVENMAEFNLPWKQLQACSLRATLDSTWRGCVCSRPRTAS